MQITLNDQLQPSRVQTSEMSHLITSPAMTQHPLEGRFRYSPLAGKFESTLRNAGFMGLLSHCYSAHLPLAIAPHDIWVVLMSEITKEVSQNSDQYRHLFTQSDKQENISVPSGSMTEMPMSVLSDALAQRVLFDSSTVLQQFSTQSPIVTETIQAIFCDMASPYYSYSMFCCGIPKIELLGTPEDWGKVVGGMEKLVEIFNTQALKQYFVKLKPVLEQFVNASNGDVDKDFWLDIFTQKNVGSGGDLTIDGWCTQLFIKQHSFAKLNNFTSTHGVVKYTQEQTKEEFVAVYGGFDAKPNAQGFCQLEYSKHILQKTPY